MPEKKEPRIRKNSALPLARYLHKDQHLQAKSLRMSEELWSRVEALAGKHKVSVNALIVAVLERACDEEGT